MAIQFHNLRPLLRTKDLRATVDFYTKRLGFLCDSFSERDGWASLRRDSVELDVVNVCYPMEDFFYGMREFAIYDNNGYMLQFGSPL